MADYIQHGGLPPSTPNPLIFPSRLSTTFPAYFCRITNLTYQTHKVLGHKEHGKRPPDRPWHRWKLPLEKTLTSLNLGFRLPFMGFYAEWITENDLLIDLDIDGNSPLEKTLNCLNLCFRLPFLGIYAGWWAQGCLLLLICIELYCFLGESPSPHQLGTRITSLDILHHTTD